MTFYGHLLVLLNLTTIPAVSSIPGFAGVISSPSVCGLIMSLTTRHPFVQPVNMALREASVVQTNDVGSLGKRPLPVDSSPVLIQGKGQTPHGYAPQRAICAFPPHQAAPVRVRWQSESAAAALPELPVTVLDLSFRTGR